MSKKNHNNNNKKHYKHWQNIQTKNNIAQTSFSIISSSISDTAPSL